MKSAECVVLLLCLSAQAFALDVPIGDLTAPPATIPETRIVVNNCVLLSKDGQLLAAVRIREATADSATMEVLPLEAARAALQLPKVKNESVSERHDAIPGAPNGTELSVLLQSRPTMQGVRMLVSSALSRPVKTKKSETAASNLELTPLPLEIALQIYPDADGNALQRTFVDGDPVNEKNAGVQELRARALTFEILKKQRINVERSGPVNWRERSVGRSTILSARLARDAHAAGRYGSFVLFVGAGHDEEPPEVSPVKLNKIQLPARDFLEGRVRVYANGANPFLLQEVSVVAEIALPPNPDGLVPKRNLPCFFWEPGNVTEINSSEGEFRFRFSPPTEGLYAVRVYVTTPGGKCNTDGIAFKAGVPASPGFVRVKQNERVMRLDDGTIFTPAGVDLGHFGAQDGLDAFKAKFSELNRCGGTAASMGLSLLMPLEGPEAGCINPYVAEMLDDIFAAAQARGVGLIFALESGNDIGANSTRHPYFHEMGGPVIAAPEYFRDPAAKRFYRIRMTYAAARYGAYQSLLSWELMRNLDEAWPPLKSRPDDKGLTPREADLSRRLRRDVEEWVGEMAQQLRGLDQHFHPICVSTSLNPDRNWTALQNLEHVSWTVSRDFIENVPAGVASLEEKMPGIEGKMAEWSAAYREAKRIKKPWGIADFGVRMGTPFGLYAALSNGLACVPMLPASPKIPLGDAEQLWLKNTRVFAAAIAEISVLDPKDELVPRAFPQTGGLLQVQVRASRRGLAAWLSKTNPTIESVSVTLPNLAEGEYLVSWFDAKTGQFVSSQMYQAASPQVDQGPLPTVIQSPAFERDLAVFIVKESEK